MNRVSLPSTDVSYYDADARRHIPCGSIVGFAYQVNPEISNRTLAKLDTTTTTPNLVHGTYSENTIVSLRAIHTITGKKAAGALGLVQFRSPGIVAGAQTTTDSFENVRMTLKFDKAVPSGATISVFVRPKRKRTIPDTLVVNINDKPDVVIPVRKYAYDDPIVREANSTIITGASIHLFMEEWSKPGINQLLNLDSRVIYEEEATGGLFYVREYTYDKVATANSPIQFLIGMETDGTVAVLRYSDIVSAYKGSVPNGQIKLRTRNFTRLLEFKPVDQVNVRPLAEFMAYDVGLITPVTNFQLSEDGFTISGKFNARCSIEHRFGTNAPVTIVTQADGSFTYTSPVTYHTGGKLILTPSNRVGSYKASTIDMPDRVAPSLLLNPSVTRTGFFATGEIGAVVSLYDKVTSTRIARYTVPSTGIIQITFPTPIPADVMEKGYYYTVEDATGNITGPVDVQFVELVEVESGPYAGNPVDSIVFMPGAFTGTSQNITT